LVTLILNWPLGTGSAQRSASHQKKWIKENEMPRKIDYNKIKLKTSKTK
jgi:hypothetical protein